MASSFWMCFILFYICRGESSKVDDGIQSPLSESDPASTLNSVLTKLNEITVKLSKQEDEITTLKDKLTSCDSVIADLTKKQESCMKESDVLPGDKEKRMLGNPNYLRSELRKMQVKLRNDDVVKSQIATRQTRANNGDTGTVYVRWGRTDCSGGATTELVYSGFAGGSFYRHSGAAADYVCLPPDPTWGPHQDINTYGHAYMYGAEYEDTILFGVPDLTKDVPCAVCRSNNHSTTLMIPARTSCYPGWQEAYRGALSAGDYRHAAATQYVCVDEAPQTLTGGVPSNDDGKMFYPVRTVCSSLQCPPYENDKVLSCVVCLK